MFRLNSLAALTAAVALTIAPQMAEAGGHKGVSVNFHGGNIQIGAPGHHTIGHISHKPYCPPVFKPIHPPIYKPVCPPVFKPIVHPPVFCPPPIVLPPPVVCPPVACPPPVVCPPAPPVICPPPAHVCPPPVITPVCCHKPVCECETTPAWYFGMSLQRIQTPLGIGLQVFSITPNSPAAVSGLKVGDVLLMANGQSLQAVQSNEEGVALLQSLVVVGQPVAATPVPTAVPTMLVSHVVPQPVLQASINLTVLDTQSNQLASLTVMPQSLETPAPVIVTAMAF